MWLLMKPVAIFKKFLWHGIKTEVTTVQKGTLITV